MWSNGKQNLQIKWEDQAFYNALQRVSTGWFSARPSFLIWARFMRAGLVVMTVVVLPARHKAHVMFIAFFPFVFHLMQPSRSCDSNHLIGFSEPMKQLLTSLSRWGNRCSERWLCYLLQLLRCHMSKWSSSSWVLPQTRGFSITSPQLRLFPWAMCITSHSIIFFM